MKLDLLMELLTSVQIGSGDEMQSDCDYLIRNSSLWVVDQHHCFERLAAQGESTVANSRTLSNLVQPLGEDIPSYALESLHGVACRPKQVRQQIKDGAWRPLMPGSSLKGAIRTALLAEHLRTSHPDTQLIPTRRDNPKVAAKPLSEAYFSSGSKRGKEPNHDWMRVWKVGDAAFDLDDLALADVRFLNLAPDLKWKKMGSRNSVANWRDASGVYAECLSRGSVASFQVSLDEVLLHAKQQMKWKDDIPDSFIALREILNQHAEYRLRRECEFYGKYDCTHALESCIHLMQVMEQNENAIYLQVGWGSGWRGMTGDWQHDVGIEQQMRNLYRLGKNGANEFPKTRRLAVYNDAPSLPFGWLRLWLKNDAPATVLERSQNKQHAQWLMNRSTSLQEIHHQQEKLLAEELARKSQREAAERARIAAEAAEQARLASISPLERELEPLLAKGENAIGELLQGLESGRWSGADTALVADKLKALLEQNGSWIPNFEGSNKLKKKKHERTLKVMRYLESRES